MKVCFPVLENHSLESQVHGILSLQRRIIEM
jgi:hypothetical protein